MPCSERKPVITTIEQMIAKSIDLWGWRSTYFRPREVVKWAYRDPDDLPDECAQWVADGCVVPTINESLWRNMERVCLNLDSVRERCGPLVVTGAGGWRPREVFPGRAARVPGSRHIHGDALDLVPRSVSPEYLFAVVDKMQRLRHVEPGGAHCYTRDGFVHVDVRGRLARW